jgi:hypothetical protein
MLELFFAFVLLDSQFQDVLSEPRAMLDELAGCFWALQQWL